MQDLKRYFLFWQICCQAVTNLLALSVFLHTSDPEDFYSVSIVPFRGRKNSNSTASHKDPIQEMTKMSKHHVISLISICWLLPVILMWHPMLINCLEDYVSPLDVSWWSAWETGRLKSRSRPKISNPHKSKTITQNNNIRDGQARIQNQTRVQIHHFFLNLNSGFSGMNPIRIHARKVWIQI